MPACSRPAAWGLVLAFALGACTSHAALVRNDALGRLTARIASTSRPDSTAVLVVFEGELRDALRAGLPPSIPVFVFWQSDVPRGRPVQPAQLGSMFRLASAATTNLTEVWVVGAPVQDPGLVSRARMFAESAARQGRKPVLRDSMRTPLGTVTFSRWVDQPGGLAQRDAMRLGQAYADSVLSHGVPKPTPITRRFTNRELALNVDSLAYYVAHLADTSFYSIGGCSEVETVFWIASERLATMGPGVVPVLVRHIEDPDPFVRERVQYALLLATQDESILARTGGEYLKFYDQPSRPPSEVVNDWWKRFAHFWAPADTSR